MPKRKLAHANKRAATAAATIHKNRLARPLLPAAAGQALVHTHRGGEVYVIDLELMTQTHTASGREQRVRLPYKEMYEEAR